MPSGGGFTREGAVAVQAPAMPGFAGEPAPAAFRAVPKIADLYYLAEREWM